MFVTNLSPQRSRGIRNPSDIDRILKLEKALIKIEKWFEEFPKTGKFDSEGHEYSYGACYGSNGERDYMRNIAREALL